MPYDQGIETFQLGRMIRRFAASSTHVFADVIASGKAKLDIVSPFFLVALAITGQCIVTLEDENKNQKLVCNPGSLGMVPPNCRLIGEKDTDTEYMMVRIEPELFESAILDDIDSMKIRDRPLFIDGDEISRNIGMTMANVVKSEPMRGDRLLIDSLSHALSIRLLQLVHHKTVTAESHSSISAHRLRRVMDYIEENLHRTIHLNELAGCAALSPYHFSREFRTAVGQSPLRCVWKRRVERAKFLLKNKDLPISIVAIDCGFSSQSHMTTVFKRETGFTPSQYRAQL